MKVENELGMVVAFYLSKYDKEGLNRLGFQTYKQAFEEIGRSLHINPNSIKNWRDEFDPYYDNARKGWYQREIRPSRLKVIAAFDELSEDAMRAVVMDIIRSDKRPKVETELHLVLQEIKETNDNKKLKKKAEYSTRGPTGRMAEEFFIAKFHEGLTPFSGVLKDNRDEGVGFDFEIIEHGNRTLVEIKGLAKESGGVSFTDKEWGVANKVQNDFYLGLVVDIPISPKIGFLQNPARNLVPVYRAYATIAVSWTVNFEQISRIELVHQILNL